MKSRVDVDGILSRVPKVISVGGAQYRSEHPEIQDLDHFVALAESIDEKGIQVPIRVSGDWVVDGWHRLAAAHLLEVPADEVPFRSLGELDTVERRIAYLMFNCARKKVPKEERDEGIRIIREKSDMSMREIARAIGVSKSVVERACNPDKPVPLGTVKKPVGSTILLSVEENEVLDELAQASSMRAVLQDAVKQHLKVAKQGQGSSEGLGSDEWYTQSMYIKAARELMGSIDLDPATCEEAQQRVQADTYYTIEDDGFSQEWRGNVWLNPPFSNGGEWMRKLLEEYQAGNVQQAAAVTHAYLDAKWWHEIADAGVPMVFTKGRPKWHRDGKLIPSRSNGGVFYFFGPTEKYEQFFEAFAELGDGGTPVMSWLLRDAA